MNNYSKLLGQGKSHSLTAEGHRVNDISFGLRLEPQLLRKRGLLYNQVELKRNLI